MTQRYKQAREDYEYLVKHHNGDVHDLAGGFNFEDSGFVLLQNPTKTQAAKIYEDMIIHSYYVGFEGQDDYSTTKPDLKDPQVVEIYTRHGILR